MNNAITLLPMEIDLTAKQRRKAELMNLHSLNTNPNPPPYDPALVATDLEALVKATGTLSHYSDFEKVILLDGVVECYFSR